MVFIHSVACLRTSTLNDRIVAVTAGFNAIHARSAIKAQVTDNDWLYCIRSCADNCCINLENRCEQTYGTQVQIKSLHFENDGIKETYCDNFAFSLTDPDAPVRLCDGDGLRIDYRRHIHPTFTNDSVIIIPAPIFPCVPTALTEIQSVASARFEWEANMIKNMLDYPMAVPLIDFEQRLINLLDNLNTVGITNQLRFAQFSQGRNHLIECRKMQEKNGTFRRLKHVLILLHVRSWLADGQLSITINPQLCDSLKIFSYVSILSELQ